MNMFFSLVHIFSLISMCTCIVWVAFRGKKGKVKYYFMLCQTLIVMWSISKITDLLAATDLQMYLCYIFGNTGVCFIGSSWVCFSEYYRSDNKGTGNISILFYYIISILNYLAVLTNPLHHLYYEEFSLLKIVHGPLFYENVVFTYVCIVIGIINIYRKTFSERKRSRGQAVLVAMSVIIPVLLNIFFVTGSFPDHFDPTPFGFTLTSIFILLAIYKYDFLDVTYVTYPRVFKNVPGGVIIINNLGIVTYTNDKVKDYIGEIEKEEDIYNIVSDVNFKKQICEPSSEAEFTINGKKYTINRYNHYGKNHATISSAFIITDISRYHELIEKTRMLYSASEEIAVEKERNRIAQEVHDTAGHTLTMINSIAKILKIKYPDLPDEVSEYIDMIATEATAGITSLRMAVNNMKRYSYTGITDSINELAKSVKEIECDVCVQGEETERYSFCSAAVYNSCREAITNSLRYSGADRIDIVLKFLENFLELYIFDNGCGCSNMTEGNGLTGISKRISEIGGTANFVSSEGNGFTVTIKIPMGDNV